MAGPTGGVPAPSQHRATVDLHDRQAVDFTRMYELFDDDPYANIFTYKRLMLLEECDRLLEGVTTGRLLDVGCGTGPLLTRYQRSGRATFGCDPSAAMLAQAARRPGATRLAAADGRRLPFADGTFDVVLAVEVVRWLPPASERRLLAEARRVLRPGGLVVLTYAPRVNGVLWEGWSQAVHLARSGRRSPVRQYSRTMSGVRTVLAEAGFDDISVAARFHGPFAFVQRLTPGHTAGLLRRWEPYDRRLAARGIAGSMANVYIASARAR